MTDWTIPEMDDDERRGIPTGRRRHVISQRVRYEGVSHQCDCRFELLPDQGFTIVCDGVRCEACSLHRDEDGEELCIALRLLAVADMLDAEEEYLS